MMNTKWLYWQQILKEVVQTKEHELSCDDLVDARIAAYAELVLANGDAHLLFPQVANHLTHCPDCAQEVKNIVEILRLAKTDQLLETPYQAQPNLSFLPAATKGNLIPQQIQELFQQGRLWVQEQTEQTWVNLAAALISKSGYQTAFATRGADDEIKTPLYRFSLGPEEVEDLDLEVTAIKADDPNRCILTIQVRKPSQWQNMAGVSIALLYGQEARSYQTDETGQVILQDFLLADLEQVKLRIALH